MRCTDIIIMEVACYATCTIPKKSQKEKKKKKRQNPTKPRSMEAEYDHKDRGIRKAH